MGKPEIAIVGAGLGGLTAAIFFHRGGYPVTIYEQAPQLARLGAGIHFAPNVTRLMRHLGLVARLVATGLCPMTWRSREWDSGRDYFSVSMNAYCEENFGAPYLIMHRGDFQGTLAAALPDSLIRYDKQLVAAATVGERVRLAFADGTAADADIVIGADGVNSRVREIIVGVEPPTYSGHVAYRAIFPTRLIGDVDVADSAKWWAPDRHFILYYLTAARDEIYFVTGAPDPTWDHDGSFAPVEMDEVMAVFEGFHDDVRRVIAVCPSATKWPLLERSPQPVWSDGRIVLLGDACHPMKPHMGQGAGMAIEDAAMLFRCLDRGGGEEPDRAFRLYEANRFARTSEVQTESHKNTWLKDKLDPGWVWGFDVLTQPITDAEPVSPAALRLGQAAPQ
jgi:6-hydroxynicotinate 3-monooxygenase